MNILEYTGLQIGRHAAQYEKVCRAIECDDFRTADVKKLSNLTHGTFYRAKLDYTNRLLFSTIRYQGQVYALMLEVIEQHAYNKSRFLRGARIDEDKIGAVDAAEAERDAQSVRYLNPRRRQVQVLDKLISFDDAQHAVYQTAPPLVIVGSAGSGKTALTLEKMKLMEGEVLYVTHSAYLAQSARELYFAQGYERDGQEATFLSYRELLETLRVPSGREASWRDFSAWFARMRQQFKGIDAHQAFEEIRGVIAADAAGPLSRADYLALGPRQSIFAAGEREAVYELFDKYQRWLDEAGLFDLNLVAHRWRALAQPRYDFIVIDEVQDLTVAQLALALACLKKPGQFLLCGDSNQIVHPNFFSWSKVKTLFWREPELAERQQLQLLRANFRNGGAVTRVANTLLKIKHARFGSIDRESNFLVDAVAGEEGGVHLLADGDAVRRDLNARTRRSTQFAVLVLRDEDKAAARQVFDTPLIFSVHEAKGLEYDSIVLYRFVSDQRAQFGALADGVSLADLALDSLDYRRARDKADKSLEIYKFYVNALYVALTRAVRHVYLIESDTGHPLLRLLELGVDSAAPASQAQASTLEDWQREARKLALQGKQEQAEAIEKMILKTTPVPWPVFDEARLRETLLKVFRERAPGSKHKQQLSDYATCFNEEVLSACLLNDAHFEAARGFHQARAVQGRRHYQAYFARNFKDILRQCDKHGVEHRTPMNQTPLMAASAAANLPLIDALLERGADPAAVDHLGRNALHWAMQSAFDDQDYARGAFAAVYQRVAPACVDVMAGDKLVRLERHQSEYLLFQTMWVLFRTRFGRNGTCAFDAETLLQAYECFPDELLRPERKKRQFLSGVLARNEVERDYAYNRRLFKRVRMGWYQFADGLALRRAGPDGEVWLPVLAALNLALIKEFAQPTFYTAIDGMLQRADLPAAGDPVTTEQLMARRRAESHGHK